MGKHNIVALSGRDKVRDELTELIREGARKLIAEGLEAEVGELLAEPSARRDGAGRAAVVRNGRDHGKVIRNLIEADDILHKAHNLAAKNLKNGTVLEQLDDRLRDLAKSATRRGEDDAAAIYKAARQQLRQEPCLRTLDVRSSS